MQEHNKKWSLPSPEWASFKNRVTAEPETGSKRSLLLIQNCHIYLLRHLQHFNITFNQSALWSTTAVFIQNNIFCLFLFVFLLYSAGRYCFRSSPDLLKEADGLQVILILSSPDCPQTRPSAREPVYCKWVFFIYVRWHTLIAEIKPPKVLLTCGGVDLLDSFCLSFHPTRTQWFHRSCSLGGHCQHGNTR